MSFEKWEEVRLGDVAKIVGGGTPNTKSDEYWNGNISWLTPNDLSGYEFKYISSGERFISELGLKKSSAKLLPKNSILMTSRAPIGYLAIAKNELCTNQGFQSIVCEKEKADFNFLYYYMTFNKDSLASIASGATFPEVSNSKVKQFKIKLPPLPTQKKIANILSNYDDLIENNLKQIKLLEEKARLTYEEWFLRFRIDGKKLDIDEETGLPFGWEKDRADKFLNVKIGKTPPRGEEHWFTSGSMGCKWVSIKDMKQTSTYIYDTSEEITFEGVKKHNMNIAKKGTVLLSFKLTVGATVITNEDVVTNEAIAHMNILHEDLYKEYLYLYLKNFNFDTLGSTSSIGTAINSKVVKAMPIVLPNTKVLNDFKKATLPIFEVINNLQKKNQLLKESRDILLPRLMTGMIDVEKLDSEV